MEKHHKNVLVLACSQALFTSTTAMMITIGGLVGYLLADNKALATLPVSSAVVGLALATIPASMLMKRVGRRAGFMIGAGFGVAGGVISGFGVFVSSFWLLTLGTLLVGVYQAHGQLYRFAAVDSAPERFKSKAISLVLAGGVVAGFMGPQLAKWTKDAAQIPFLASYWAVVVLGVVAIMLLGLLDIPKPVETAETKGAERPLLRVALQPAYIVAVLSAMVGYAVMSLIMTGTPLAMVAHRFVFADATMVIQWHVVAMFLPSFFTGVIIYRVGVLPVILVGTLLNFAAVVIGLSGVSLGNFWGTLVLVGVGWNFMFIGGTTLLTRTYGPAERAKSQALNDFMVFGSVALASLSSGQLLHYLGWRMVLFAAVPFLAMAALGALWLYWRTGAQGMQVAPAAT